MNEAQIEAFKGANPGADVTPEGLLALFAGLAAAIVLVWCLWVVFQTYKNWSVSSADAFSAGGHIVRALLVVTVMFFILGALS